MESRRKKPGKHVEESSNPGTQAHGSSAYQSRAEKVRAEIAKMEEVNRIIQDVMRGAGSHDEKVGRIAASLTELGYSESQIADIMEPKEAQGGRHFAGYTFSDINAKKGFLRTLESLDRGKSAASGGFTGREQARREQAAGEGEGQGQAHG